MSCVIVFGHHRSGSSALAGVIHNLGVSMGSKLLVGNRATNPKGHFEDTELVMLNERAIGGNWRDPRLIRAPVFQNRFHAYVRTRIRDAGRVSENVPVRWGVKDPRLCFTLPLFLKALRLLGGDAKMVVSDRRKEAVVKSLETRGALAGVDPEVIYERYEEAIRANSEGFPGPIHVVNYDFLVTHPEKTVTRLVDFLDIEPTMNQSIAAMTLVEPGLCHWPEEPVDLKSDPDEL